MFPRECTHFCLRGFTTMVERPQVSSSWVSQVMHTDLEEELHLIFELITHIKEMTISHSSSLPLLEYDSPSQQEVALVLLTSSHVLWNQTRFHSHLNFSKMFNVTFPIGTASFTDEYMMACVDFNLATSNNRAFVNLD
jgi:hypothetical protein